MKCIFLLAFNVLILVSGNCSSLTVNGTVSGLWNVDTVFVEGNLLIHEGEELVINPGTLVQFQGHFRIDVFGKILAEGNVNDTIVFSVNDTTQFHIQASGAGGWLGIRFRQPEPSQDSSLFSYCKFEYGKATGDSINSYGGAILVSGFDKVRIDNCLFFHNYSYYSGGAIYLSDANVTIKDCVFKGNYAGNASGTIYGYGGGICSMYSSPEVRWNEFYDNSSTGVGGGASFDNSDPMFDFNIMKGNFSGLGGALGVLRSSPLNTLSNNLIIDNEALFFGGGICCIRSFPVFSNITIADNFSVYGGGLYCNDSAAPKIYNSIIWNNTGFGQSVYIWDIYSAPCFYYSNIEGDTTGFEGSGAHWGYSGLYYDNINEDPLFYGMGDFPYMLSESSPCRDAGTPDPTHLNLPATDIAHNPRFYNTLIDMGAYEYIGPTSVSDDASSQGAIGYPNPFTDNLTIYLPDAHKQSHYKLMIYDIYARLVYQVSTAEGIVKWNGCDLMGNKLPKGLYIVSVTNDDKSTSIRVVKQ